MKSGNRQYSYFQQFINGTTKGVLMLFLGLLLSCSGLMAQNTELADSLQANAKVVEVDSVSVVEHSPHKATIYSMILPGLGQAYNKKYWKIPIIYAGFGVFYYLIDYNATEYQLWRDAYNHTLLDPDGLEEPVNEYEELYGDNPDFLKSQKNDARRYRDLNWILAGLWYVLNVLDATVDAHLFSWNVDDNLSLRLEPHMYTPSLNHKPAGGVKLSLRF